jgi:uncharacterized protein (TIGR03437 family)
MLRAALSLCVLALWPTASQAQWDNTGNSLLNGMYYFRQVVYLAADQNGDLSEAIAIYGNITFSGNGTYSITNAIASDSSNTSYGTDPLSCWLANTECAASAGSPVNGNYSIAASGFGFLTSPIAGITTSTTQPNGDLIYGLVSSNGILIGSSTETASGYNDLFIAAPVGAATPNFQGTYTMAGYLPAGSPSNAADVFFQMTPNGGGSLGTVNITGYVGGSSTLSQSSPVTYKPSSGAEIVSFPNVTTANFYAGSEYLYFSPDGSFCFGGSPNGYDMLVGVRSDSSNFNSNAIYYAAGLDLDTSTLASGYATADSYYGSFTSNSGTIIEAARINAVAYTGAYSSTFGDTTTDTDFDQFAFANGGGVLIGAGVGPYLGLKVGLQAPKLPGSSGFSVYLDPTSLENTASYAPFTAGVSVGEVVTLYGKNLASKTVVASTVPYPTFLGGVQVLVNGVAAPLVYVSAGQLSAVIPYETTASVAQIQVVNNNTLSNTITAFVNETTAGVFTQLQNTTYPAGLGYAVAVHNADFSLVTPLNPAQPGEYIAAYVTGLGTVFPTVADGAAGPTNPASYSYYCEIPSDTSGCMISVGIQGVAAPLVFAGLAPDLAGIYQIDFQVPATGLSSGDQVLQLCGPDSCTAEGEITIAGGTISSLAEEKHATAFPRKVPRKKSAVLLRPLNKPTTGLR